MNDQMHDIDPIADDPPEIQIIITPRAQAALDEIRSLIAFRFPQATFDVQKGYEPAGIYLVAVVDVDDLDEVRDVYMTRLVDMQVDDRIPVYVRVKRPFERTWARFQEEQTRRAQSEPTPVR